MRVYDMVGDNGTLRGFEVDNHALSRRAVALLVSRLPGVRILRAKSSWFADDEFCKFVLGGVEFSVWEPFGDNSRYWVVPSVATDTSELQRVRQLFVDYKPSIAGHPLVVVPCFFAGIFVLASLAGSMRPIVGGDGTVIALLLAAAALVFGLWYRDRRLMAGLPWSDQH